MESKDIYALMGRVLSGEADLSDRHRLRQWLDEAEENQAIYDSLHQVWNNTQEKASRAQIEKAYQKFSQKRQHASVDADSASVRSVIMKVAQVAAILLLIISGYWYLSPRFDTTDNPIVAQADSIVVKENPAGQKLKVVLSDGSIVWLNSESKLSYPANFSDTARRIELVGEAYFQVAKEANRPFVVLSGELQTTALGTAFNVRHFPEDSLTVIFLTEGEVRIENADKSHSAVYLDPGWGVSSAPGHQRLERFADTPAKWASWKDGVLHFENNTLIEIIAKCQRWYGTEFSVEGSPDQDWTFTGKFTNESLENVLNSMQYGTNFDYTIQNKRVNLTFNR